MQPGPLHLFWTTGVFYFWKLKACFDFVFIVPSVYLESNEFQKLIQLPSARHVEYLHPATFLLRDLIWAKQFSTVLNEYPPKYLLLHNRSYPENQYLIHLARKIYPESLRFYYQNGRMPLLWDNDFSLRHSIDVESIVNRFLLFSRLLWLASGIVSLKYFLRYLLFYKILPFFIVGKVFTPPVNIYTGFINIQASVYQSKGDFDKILCYLELEARVFQRQGNKNIFVVRHPMSQNVHEFFSFMHGNFKLKDQILVVPSTGFTSGMIRDGFKKSEIIRQISEAWIKAIKKLQTEFPGYDVLFKIHVASHADPIWQEICRLLQLHLSYKFHVIQQKVSAEWLVAQSKVIVGDVTTVLWWAALYGNKTVISFDIFGFKGGNELKSYAPLIGYVSDLGEKFPANVSQTIDQGQDLNLLFL